MTWSEAKRRGLALAALLWDDRQGERAALAPELAKALRATLAPLAQADAEEKTRTLRAWAASVRGDVTALAERLPPRARVQLARHVPRELGRRWLEGAPPARPDFALERPLLLSLLHMARGATRSAHAAPHSEE